MAAFCTKCGTELINGVCPKCTQVQQTTNKQDEKFKRFFMSPKEKLVTTLGNTYIQNYLANGSIEKGFAVVSDKRVYFQGTTYELVTKRNGKKKAVKTVQSRTVDLKDVTGSGFDYTENFFLKILRYIFFILIPISIIHGLSSDAAGVPLLCVITAIIISVSYYLSIKHLIGIQFAGGGIAFKINWFSQKEIDDFQRLVRLAKDKAIDDAENAVANKLQDAVASVSTHSDSANSTADELLKYAQLLKDGLISQDEFEYEKRKLIQGE